MSYSENRDIENFIWMLKKIMRMKKLVISLAVILIILYVQPFRLKVIDSAEIGIKFRKWTADGTMQGGVEGTCKGLLIYNRYTTSVFSYPAFVQRKAYEPFYVNTNDASEFKMDPQIAYHIDPEKACDIFVKYRRGIKSLEEGFIKTCIYNAYRDSANSYTSQGLMSNRVAFENNVRNLLDKKLGKEGFIVDEFTSAITPPESLKKAIAEKNEAVQAALKAENLIKEAQKNAEKKIAEATGDAEAAKIRAFAEAQANEAISRSLNENLLKKMWIEKWDGAMPKTIAGEKSLMKILEN